MIHIIGSCALHCPGEPSGEPRQVSSRDRPPPKLSSKFKSYKELETHYNSKLQDLRRTIATAEARVNSTGQHRHRQRLEDAKDELAKTQREFEIESDLYRMQEAILDDEEKYEGW